MKRIYLAVILAVGSITGCSAGVYYAPVAPPPPRVERYGVAPGAGYVWASGYWGWRGGAYAWVPGRWDRPPRARAVWAPGYWEHRGGRYRFHDGRWR